MKTKYNMQTVDHWTDKFGVPGLIIILYILPIGVTAVMFSIMYLIWGM